MKHYLRHIILAALLILGLCVLTSSPAFAQPIADSAAQLDAVDTSVLGIDILGILATIAQKYPIVGTIIAFIGLTRTFAKPLFSFIHAVIDLTPSKTDDAGFNKVLLFFNENKIGRTIAYVFDYLASFKIAPPKKPSEFSS
jgi:ABC-type bacteriocin/lantibiotic exporter with double-glycine peptidase domain